MRASAPARQRVSDWRRAFVLSTAVVVLGLVLTAGAATWVFAPEGPPLVSGALLLDPFASLVLASGLWLVALIAERASRHDLAWVALLCSAICAAGRWAAEGSATGNTAYLVLLLWSGPSVLRFHQYILEASQGCAPEAGTWLLLLAGAGLTAPLILYSYPVLTAQAWYPMWRTAASLPLVVSALLSAFAMVLVRIEGWAEVRQQRVRVITLGVLVAAAPSLALTLLPLAWGAPLYLPLSVTAPFLLIASRFYLRALEPVGAGDDRRLRDMSVLVLVATTLAAGVLVAAAILNSASVPPTSGWPLLVLVLIAEIWFAWRPLWEMYLRLAENAWLGHGASYAQVVGRLAESLSVTLEPEALQRALVHRLARAMYVSWTSLYLRTDTMTYALSGSHGMAPTALLAHRTLPSGGALIRFLTDWARPATHEHMQQALRDALLEPDEVEALGLPGAQLWVPLMAGGVLHGVLLLGPRPGGQAFSREDIQILTTLGHQSGVAIQNTRLVMEVEAGREELARAHQQLLDAGEQERLTLAQELHDGAVQQLIAVSYQLAAARRAARAVNGDSQPPTMPDLLESTRQQILSVVSQIRYLISELRPPGLEDLGLVATLESYVQRVQVDADGRTPTISLNLDVDDRRIPQSVALCLFRVAQEGLRNVLRHAEATRVDLRLTMYGGYVELRLVDNGRGFVVPARLSEMAARNHFGLVSMAERVARVGGIFTITSEPGAGTQIRVQVALDEEDSRGGRADSRAVG